MKLILLAAAMIFRLLDVNSGLPENNVRNMMMLPNGMMCIQTSEALSLYDGVRVRSYRYDPARVPYSEYSGMTESWYDPGSNRIWCKAKDKLWTFGLETGEFNYDCAGALSDLGINAGDISGFCIDSTGTLWLSTSGGTLWRKDLRGGSATPATSQAIPCHSDNVLMERSGDTLMLLSSDGILIQYSIPRNGIEKVTDLGNEIPIKGSSHIEMSAGGKGRIWIMTDKSVTLAEAEGTGTRTVMKMSGGSSDLFTSIATDTQGRLWVGTARSGVSIVDESLLGVENLPSLKLTTGEEIHHHTDISKIYSDPRGGIWISTLTEGLMYNYPSTVRFENINRNTVRGGEFADEGVKCLLEGGRGKILVGTIKGLLEYDPSTQKLTIPWKELSDELVISLYRDTKDRIWVGSFYNGAFCIEEGKVRHFRYDERLSVDASYQSNTPNNNCVRCFYEDSLGNLWVSIYGGLGILNPQDGKISQLRDKHPELNSFMIIRSICEVSPGVLLACGDNGSFRYDVSTDKVLSADSAASSNIAYVDSRGVLWSSGLENLPGIDANAIMSLTEDDCGNIWMASYGHIFCVRAGDSVSGGAPRIIKYGKQDGIGAGAFFQNSILKHSDGSICFGGVRGITVIRPSAEQTPDEKSSPTILSFKANGAAHTLSRETELEIAYNDVPLEISFSCFDLANPGHVLYSYTLDGFDKTWQNIPQGQMPVAKYTYIRPGDYVFRVKSCTLGGNWEEASVPVKVKPHFLASKVAIAIYSLLFILAVIAIIKAYKSKEQKKMRQQMEIERIRRQEELDQMKFRFFTNISHELRTPLSLIMLPLQSLMKENGDHRLELIRKNANDLLDLVNHLLDFRKLEMGGEKLSLSKGDISEYISITAEKFREAFAHKKIIFEVLVESTNVFMAFDPSKIRKIVNNLLSNAMKFTEEGGYVCIKLRNAGQDFVIEVSDTGIGMSLEDKERIFDRFYRSPEVSDASGTGIGLNLVKQYVDMMSGKIEIESSPGKGSCFRISLPATLQEDASPAQPEAAKQADEIPEESAGGKSSSRILLVDDNDTFREYLSGELSPSFEILQAGNGVDALKLLKESSPDVIVCDVMMPQMDGLEFTAKVKGNLDTSHIPVILLTARQADEVRLEGYENGADAYLTKPFQMDMLLARIHNLLEERNRRMKEFATSAEYSPMEVTVTTLDQKFMQKVMESVERNIGNASYSVEMLASDVSMHRMNLYRKLQAITGVAPLEFIRKMRLKRAAQLIKADPGLNVNEVADMVGFSTTKYFSKYFKEMFGVNPSQYARQDKI